MSISHPRPTLWSDRKFEFPNDMGEKEAILHHLSTFPSQCAILIDKIPHEKFTSRINEKWSIQEHIGHLLDMEELPTIRIEEILAGKKVLTAADMTNRLTWSKNYNEQNIYGVCERFIERRRELVNLFNSVPENKWLDSALHERLNRQMSILSLAYFQCQHDMYHYDMIVHLTSVEG